MFRSVILSFVLSANAVNYGRTRTGEPICLNGVWNEVNNSELMQYKITPEVQCWRKPPCIRWTYLTPERCKAFKNDDDFPTYDNYLSTTPAMPTIRTIMEEHLRNKTVFVVGDSINGLIYNAAICETRRWGLNIDFGHETNIARFSEGVQARLQTHWKHMARFTRLHKAAGGGNGKIGFWIGDAPQVPDVVLETETMIVTKGWHRYLRSDMGGILTLADVIVVNYGLHYRAPTDEAMLSDYEEAMTHMFRQLEAWARQPGKTAIVRETSAQHYLGTGAYAGREQSHLTKGSTCTCAPTDPEIEKNNVLIKMNAVLHRLASTHPHVFILPFYNITAQRHDAHEGEYCAFEAKKQNVNTNDVCCDCTHLCYTPQLWRHVFAGLGETLRKAQVGNA